jgi:hypothetical protein
MDKGTVQMIVDAAKSLGMSARDAFVWWYVVGLIKDLAMTVIIVGGLAKIVGRLCSLSQGDLLMQAIRESGRFSYYDTVKGTHLQRAIAAIYREFADKK